MPRATNKTDLLAAIDQEHAALDATLKTISIERLTEPGVVGEWSVKDVLAHLIEWQQMALGWYRAGLCGERPQVPAPGYKWSETPQLNRMIYEKHRDRPLDEVMEQFDASHREILGVIQGLSNEELFTAGCYAWMNKNTLGAYFVSATSSHYLWARKEVRKWLKSRPG